MGSEVLYAPNKYSRKRRRDEGTKKVKHKYFYVVSWSTIKIITQAWVKTRKLQGPLLAMTLSEVLGGG